MSIPKMSRQGPPSPSINDRPFLRRWWFSVSCATVRVSIFFIAAAATCERASATVLAVAVCALLMKLIPADRLERSKDDRAREHEERYYFRRGWSPRLRHGAGRPLSQAASARAPHVDGVARHDRRDYGAPQPPAGPGARNPGRLRAPVLHQPKGRTRIAWRPVTRARAGFPPIRTRERALATDDENVSAGSL